MLLQNACIYTVLELQCGGFFFLIWWFLWWKCFYALFGSFKTWMLVCIHFKCRQKRMPKRRQLITVVSHVIWRTSYFSSGTQKMFYRKEICFKWLLFIFGKLYLSSPRSLPNKVAYSIHVITWKQKCAYMYSMNQVFLDLLVNFKLTSMHFKYFIDIRSEN